MAHTRFGVLVLSIFVLAKYAITQDTQNCGGNIDLELEPTGVITSPGYPERYPEKVSCCWHLKANLGEKIGINFMDFDVTGSKDCSKDFLFIEDVSLSSEAEQQTGATLPKEHKYCGANTPQNMTSNSNDITITFRSNRVGSCRGFNISYFIVEESLTCGSTTNAMQFNFESPNYPNSIWANESLDCMLTVDHGCQRDICQIRLDFEDFRIQPPFWGDCRHDSFSIENDRTLPILCGNNNGSHVYVDVQGRGKTSLIFMIEKIERHLYNCYDIYDPFQSINSSEEESAEMIHHLDTDSYSLKERQFNKREDEILGTVSTTSRPPTTEAIMDITVALFDPDDHVMVEFPTHRSWKIKVTQIPCHCPKTRVPKAPDGCLQYHQGVSGVIESFNFQNMGCYTENHWCDFSKIKDPSECDIRVGYTGHLNNLDYAICVEPVGGFCGIEYHQENQEDFSLSTQRKSDSQTPYSPLEGDSQCNADFIFIPQAQTALVPGDTTERFCGGSLAQADQEIPVCSLSKPFIVRAVTDNDEFSSSFDYMNRGFRLKYYQVPCQ